MWSTVASLRLHSLSFPPTHRPASTIAVHCSFVRASLPLFFHDTEIYVKNCGLLWLRYILTPSHFPRHTDLRQRLWSTVASLRLHSLSFPPKHRPTSKIVVHCSFVKASLPIFFPDTQTYVKDWSTVASLKLHSLSLSPTHRPTSKIVVHCRFVKASLPIFFHDTQTYVKDCGPL